MEANSSGGARVEGYTLDALVKLKSITRIEVERLVVSRKSIEQNGDHSRSVARQSTERHRFDQLMADFAECCRASSEASRPESWKVEKLDFMEDCLGNYGLVALVVMLERGYFGRTNDLRIRVNDDVSWSSMDMLLDRLKNVRKLHLHFDCLLTDQIFVVFLKKFAEVLPSNHFSEIVVTRFGGHNDELEVLNGCRSRYGVKVARVLADQFAAGHLHNLRELTLCGLGIGCEGLVSLALAFDSRHTRELEVLQVRYNGIGLAGAVCLAKALKSGHLGSLQILDLSCNRLLDEGVEYLARALKSGKAKNLEALGLSDNEIGDEGVRFLGAALVSGKCLKLRSLDLGKNGISTHGLLKAFGSSVVSDFQTLDLSGNWFLGAPKENFANFFQADHARRLEILSLAGAGCRDDAILFLAETFKSGKYPRLRSLDVSNNSFRIEGLTALTEAFESGNLSALETVNLEQSLAECGVAAVNIVVGCLHARALPRLQELVLVGLRDLYRVYEVDMANAYAWNPYLTVRLWSKSLVYSQLGAEFQEFQVMSKSWQANVERVARLKVLQDEEDVLGQHAKLFFCGNPRVGKTTLRVTLAELVQNAADTTAKTMGDEAATTAKTAEQEAAMTAKIADKGHKSDTTAKTAGDEASTTSKTADKGHKADATAKTAVEEAATTATTPETRERADITSTMADKADTMVEADTTARMTGSAESTDTTANTTDKANKTSTKTRFKRKMRALWSSSRGTEQELTGSIEKTTKQEPSRRTEGGIEVTKEQEPGRGTELTYKQRPRRGVEEIIEDSKNGMELEIEEEDSRNGMKETAENEESKRGMGPTKAQGRTRGIEVNHIQSEGLTVALWDLAGQHDYEILHSAFLPDLNFANGQATFFVIMCRADKLEQGRRQLEYWMRFISSHSPKDIPMERRRRCFVVLNCWTGHGVADAEVQRWKKILVQCDKSFGAYLNLHKDPFFANVTRGSDVKGFKSTIWKEAREVLQRRKMPKICHTIQEEGRRWMNSQKDLDYPVLSEVEEQDKEQVRSPKAAHVYCPVLTWDEYTSLGGNANLEEEKLKAAAEYLHEAGHIILFRKVTTSFSLDGEIVTVQGGLVIVDPEWLCKDVVGNLLLPKDMAYSLQDRLDLVTEEEGVSLPISSLENFKIPPNKVEQVVMILTRMGICYQLKDRPQDMFVPALIEDGEVGRSLEGQLSSKSIRYVGGGAWVMGFALRVQNLTCTLLPVIVLRKLQVNFALDESIGRREDRDYQAKRNGVSFKFEGMYVVLEYAYSKQDRLDILVRPCVENWSRKVQINIAQTFANRVANIVQECLGGVELEKHIIQPWTVAEGWKSIERRNIKTTAASVIDDAKKKGQLQRRDWVVGGYQVQDEDILSDEDLFTFLDTISKKRNLTEQAVTYLNKSSEEIRGEGAVEAVVRHFDERFSEVSEEPRLELEGPLQAVVRHFDRRFSEVLRNQKYAEELQNRALEELKELKKDIRGSIEKVLQGQHSLNLQIRNLETFSVEEKESSVPRFVYVTEKGKDARGWRKWLIELTDAVVKTSVMRFLCEASYDSETFHEVPDQEGIEIPKIQEWAKTLVPLLLWTLKVGIVATKIAGNAILPGLGILLSDNAQLSQILDKITEMTVGGAELSKYLFEALDKAFLEPSVPDSSAPELSVPGTWDKQMRDLFQGKGSVQRMKLKGHPKAAVRKALDRLEYGERRKKVGLNRVWLDGRKRVVWICNECHSKYGDSAHDV